MSSAILASYVKLSTLVDGTLRLVFDVEPSEAAKFFPPPAPGASFGLARIEENAAQKAVTKQAERKRWGDMPLSQQAAIRCGERDFWHFLDHWTGARVPDADEAAKCVRDLCRVESRREFDTDTKAAEAWLSLNEQFFAWQRGVAA